MCGIFICCDLIGTINWGEGEEEADAVMGEEGAEEEGVGLAMSPFVKILPGWCPPHWTDSENSGGTEEEEHKPFAAWVHPGLVFDLVWLTKRGTCKGTPRTIFI